MVDITNKSQAKTAMLLELESIKGLLQENDEIPILQEIEDSSDSDSADAEYHEQEDKPRGRHFVEQQQDFFHNDHLQDVLSAKHHSPEDTHSPLGQGLFSRDQAIKAPSQTRPEPASKTALKKPTGENPFLPEHIRARLHGNNPPPSFEQITANRIAQTHKPSRQLGKSSLQFAQSAKENLINEIVDKFLPEIEVELREKLEKMTEQQLDELRRD